MPGDTSYVRGAQKLKKRLETIRANLGLAPLVEEIGGLLLRRTQQRFDQEVDPDYNPWQPLAQATLERKQRGGYGDKGILVRKGDLRGAIHLIRGGLGTAYINTGAGVRIGVDDPDVVPYAIAQNKGTLTIPARRFLGIGERDVKAADNLMRRKARQLESISSP